MSDQAKYGGECVRGVVSEIRQRRGRNGTELEYEVNLDNGKRVHCAGAHAAADGKLGKLKARRKELKGITGRSKGCRVRQSANLPTHRGTYKKFWAQEAYL